MREAATIAGAVALAFAIIIGVALGGQELGLWMEKKGTNRQTEIANDSLARQQAFVDDVTDKSADIADLDVEIARAGNESDLAARLRAQRGAVVGQFCTSYSGLTGRLTVSASVDALAAQECP